MALLPVAAEVRDKVRHSEMREMPSGMLYALDLRLHPTNGLCKSLLEMVGQVR